MPVRFSPPGARAGEDCGCKGAQVPRAVVAVAVDEKSGRAVHTAAHAAEEILTDPRRVEALDQFELDRPVRLLGVRLELEMPVT